LPAVEYGGSAIDLKGFNSNNGQIELWSKADDEKFNRSMEGIQRAAESAGQAAEALKQLSRRIAVPNPPAVPRPALLPSPADDTLPSPPTASAASHAPSKHLEVKKNRVLERANRNGFPVGTLFKGDEVIAKDVDKKHHDVVVYADGDMQNPVWVRFKGTFGNQPAPAHSNPRVPILTGEAARDYLLDNYAFAINALDNQPSPARITRLTRAYQNYTNGLPLDPLNRQLLPYDPVNNPRKFAWRWITDDRKYVMGRECRVDPATGKCADGAPTYWVYVSVCDVTIPGFSLPCQQ
jgi:hypothetical protein